MLSRDVDASRVASGSSDAHMLAEQIIRSQQAAINKFVARQRQQIELGEKDVHNARLPLDGVDVYYTHVQGLERLHYHVQPELAAVPEKPEELAYGQPEFLTIPIPGGLAVEFSDGAS
jgi:hypothetical protein